MTRRPSRTSARLTPIRFIRSFPPRLKAIRNLRGHEIVIDLGRAVVLLALLVGQAPDEAGFDIVVEADSDLMLVVGATGRLKVGLAEPGYDFRVTQILTARKIGKPITHIA